MLTKHSELLGTVEFFAGWPAPDDHYVSVEIDGDEIRVGGDASIANFMNDALLKGKVQVFGLPLLEECISA